MKNASPRTRTRRVLTAFLAAALLAPTAAAAQDGPHADVRRKGVEYLRKAIRIQSDVGQLSLMAMAMMVNGVPKDDPDVRQAVDKVVETLTRREKTSGGILGVGQVGHYQAGCVMMLLLEDDPEKHYRLLEALTDYVLRERNSFDAWHYVGNNGPGDTSQTQYAVLGLWAAAAAGVAIEPEDWDRTLYWLIHHQDNGGGFVYHPKPVPEDQLRINQIVSPARDHIHSMGVAGAACLYICMKNLPGLKNALDRKIKREHKDEALLIPVIEIDEEVAQIYQPKVDAGMAARAVELADKWNDGHLDFDKPESDTYGYYLYGLERYAALAGRSRIGGKDWYDLGAEELRKRQLDDGSWSGKFQAGVETAWCLLFLGRSTEKKVKKFKLSTVGGGTQVGGRGLPTAGGGDSMSVRKRARWRREVKTDVEDFIKALETPDENDMRMLAAVAETIDPKELMAKLGDDPARLRKYVRNGNRDVRYAVFAALSRLDDFRVAPILIRGLRDDNPEVYAVSRNGLIRLSRRADAFGMPRTKPEDPQEVAQAVANWSRWYASLQVQVDSAQEFDDNLGPLPAGDANPQ